MKDIIYIIGHKNPDTDSVCSVIAYAELKNRLGYNAVPVCLGEINRETDFVLKYFGVDVPVEIANVKTQVADLNIDIVNTASPDISVRTAWMIMNRNNIKTLPVVDENGRFLGLVTLSDITEKYMDIAEDNIIANSNTPLHNIVDTLKGQVVQGSEEDFRTSGRVVIAAAPPEEMVPFIQSGDIVITGNRADSQYQAIENGANCIIITCGGKANKEVLELAGRSGCVVIETNIDTYTAARLISQSIPISYLMTNNNIVSFNIDDFIDDIKAKMLQTRFRSYPVIDDTNKFIGLISRYHLISQRRKKVILLDHNEKSQTVNGIEEAEILEIIDHHRVGDVQTVNPIFFKNEPLGSTATIIANLFFENGITPSKNIAGILCAAIISDTIHFKSPTSTYQDRNTAEKLARLAALDIDKFAVAMLKAGTSLKGKEPREIFYQDFKKYELGNYKIGISQIHTMDLESLNNNKPALIEFMNSVCQEKDYDLVVLMVTDILQQGSEFLFVGEEHGLIEKAFNVKLGPQNQVFIPGIMSRKKQVVPQISLAVE
jgi:manganese-dependent inorganic pyrophosphatase